VIYSVGLVALHYPSKYGIEYLLGAIGATVLTAGFWMRTHWDHQGLVCSKFSVGLYPDDPSQWVLSASLSNRFNRLRLEPYGGGVSA
jgi:hypothetical protein